MKAKSKPSKSLITKTGGSRDPAASPFPRSHYKSKFDKMVKGGMSRKDAARAIKKIMQDDHRREMDEYNF